MPPPRPGSSAPAPERRLAVLLSHFRPCREPPRAAARLASAERRAAEAEDEAQAGLAASPCLGGGSGKGECESSRGGRCVFCSIVAGTAPAFKLYEDDVCLCILDAKPLTAGHSLIIPKSHHPSLQTTPPAVLAAIFSKLPLLGTAIMKATQCECIRKHLDSKRTVRLLLDIFLKVDFLGAVMKHVFAFLFASIDGVFKLSCRLADAFNVLINNGEKAGQVIFHTHVHIIPRSKDDNLWSSETYSRNPISHGQETKNLVSSIKDLLSSSPEDYSTVTPSAAKGF